MTELILRKKRHSASDVCLLGRLIAVCQPAMHMHFSDWMSVVVSELTRHLCVHLAGLVSDGCCERSREHAALAHLPCQLSHSGPDGPQRSSTALERSQRPASCKDASVLLNSLCVLMPRLHQSW